MHARRHLSGARVTRRDGRDGDSGYSQNDEPRACPYTARPGVSSACVVRLDDDHCKK